MHKSTKQENFWEGDFGKKYTDRNDWLGDEEWDNMYIQTWGRTKLQINSLILDSLPKDIRILEVGCNFGAQLRGFQRMGFNNLYGVELQEYAVVKSKERFKNLNIIQASGFELPFKEGYFDLVCTNGVLIHISPDDHFNFMSEIVRCSRQYIMGWEYYNSEVQELTYRDNSGCMWKADYAKIYQNNFSCLKLNKEERVKYLANANQDSIFLLEKV